MFRSVNVFKGEQLFEGIKYDCERQNECGLTEAVERDGIIETFESTVQFNMFYICSKDYNPITPTPSLI